MAITPALVCFLVANLLDGIITLTLLQLQIGKELNPLMLWAYHQSPLMLMIVKTLVVSMIILIITASKFSSDRKQRLIKFGAIVFLLVVTSQFVQLAALACS